LRFLSKKGFIVESLFGGFGLADGTAEGPGTPIDDNELT